MLLLRIAYHVQDFQIVGLPEWAKTERFSIAAKSRERADEDPTKVTQEHRDAAQKRVQLRLQDLFENRFALKAHRETREMPVYELVVGKNGPKLAAARQANGKSEGVMRMGRGEFSGTRVRADVLARAFGDLTGRPVIDKTGLTGEYDFKLRWTPEPGEGPIGGMSPPPGAQAPGAAEAPVSDATGPSLTTAI
jgi:uncharacterized protein (TIGR03435 family)